MEIEGVPLTYAELDQRANRLAHLLLEQGLDPGAPVAILLHRSVETYVALLAVLKAGASFLPIDPNSPQDRVEYILDDATAVLLLTSNALAPAPRSVKCPVVCLDQLEPVLSQLSSARPRVIETGDPTAYIIYTSGSSGRPKGVEVAQSSICNFINVVPTLYRVSASDRVYQGMTIAFDFSIEEIWPTWAVGAAVIAGPNDGRRLGSELAEFLQTHRVTVLYCVPTVLATIDRDLPLVHTLNVGGEACPKELVDRWSRADRVMLNTYGPTEATVTCIMATLEPGLPVTIGQPLPTYEAYLLDEERRQVPDGEVGEICIGGPGVARGYVGRPDLTAEKFIANPFRAGGRLYCTGDLGRMTPHGIEYKGRADSEVKIRGHRIDLQEIESVLRTDAAVSDAVVRLSDATDELAAYITTADASPPEDLSDRLHAQMRKVLPPYMVPAFLTVVDMFPLLPSGKVDRKSLPEPRGARLVSNTGNHKAPSTQIEREVCQVWAETLHLDPEQLSVDADFFVDLGGHSLAAATVVSTLRRHPGFGHLAIRDLYARPTIEGLARRFDDELSLVDAAPVDVQRNRRDSEDIAEAGLAQLSAVYILLLVVSLPLAVIYSVHHGQPSLSMGLQLAVFLPLSFFVARWVLPVVGVRLLSNRLSPGTYPLWSRQHLFVWCIQKLLAFSPLTVLSGSPMIAPYLRMLGARIGRDTHIASGEVGVPAFLRIGDGASVGHAAQLLTTSMEAESITIGPVVVGGGAFVGASSMVLPNSALGAKAGLGDHSVLGPSQVIPDGQHRKGSPSTPSPADPLVEAMATATDGGAPWTRQHLRRFGLGLVVLELLPFAMSLPVVLVVWWTLLQVGMWAGLAVTILTGPLFVATVCGCIGGLRALVLPQTPTGTVPARSDWGLRKWFVDKLFEMSLLFTNSLYATLYTVPWLRLLGAKIGPGCEVSTVASVSPDLLVLHGESFVADMAQVGSATYHNGLMSLQTTEVGHRAFVGNAAFVPAGTRLGDDSLIGVHTVPPPEGVENGTSWLGSPAMFLARRQESEHFSETLTYRPTPRRYRARLAIEFLRMTMPASILATAAYLALMVISRVAATRSLVVVVLATPAIWLLSGLSIVLFVALLKWVIVGAYQPRVEPLWSGFVRQSEFVTGLYEGAAVPALLQVLTGTPLLGPLLRLFGAQVGQRTLIDTTYLTEFDLVHVGDDAVVGAGASLQTHLFEDRVMKMAELSLEAGATVGPRSVVLYGASVGRECTVGPMSLVMKGESLVPGTQWAGIPAEYDVQHEDGNRWGVRPTEHVVAMV